MEKAAESNQLLSHFYSIQLDFKEIPLPIHRTLFAAKQK